MEGWICFSLFADTLVLTGQPQRIKLSGFNSLASTINVFLDEWISFTSTNTLRNFDICIISLLHHRRTIIYLVLSSMIYGLYYEFNFFIVSAMKTYFNVS